VLLGRIGFGRPKQDFFLFSFLFLFLSLFKFKLCSNLIQTLVTKYSRMILRHKQYYFEDILLFILFFISFLFLVSLLEFLFQTLEFLLGFNFPLGY
jgi:dolichol kinase